MAELLLELFSEEIPARMQARAAEELKRLVTEKLKAAGLAFAKAESYVTPRRLALGVHDLPTQQPDVGEEKKGLTGVRLARYEAGTEQVLIGS